MKVRLASIVAVVATAGALAAAVPAASAKTVWLCFPGHHPDPCAPSLGTTVYTPKLKKIGVIHPRR